jgi:hypothetical protein
MRHPHIRHSHGLAGGLLIGAPGHCPQSIAWRPLRDPQLHSAGNECSRNSGNVGPFHGADFVKLRPRQPQAVRLVSATRPQ